MNRTPIAGLLAIAFAAVGCSVVREGGPSMSYALEVRQGSDDVVFTCKASSSGTCSYWVGIPGTGQVTAWTTLPVGEHGITKMAHDAVYCVGVDPKNPPAWPSCATSSPGGLLYRTTSVDYRWW